MPEFKTYDTVHETPRRGGFRISRMRELYALHGGIPDEPHRHDYFTVLIVQDAQGEHRIDFYSYPMSGGQIFFVTPGQLHQVIETRVSEGFVMAFSRSFLEQNSISWSFLRQLHLFNDYGHSPPLVPESEEFEKIVSMAEEIHRFYGSEEVLRESAIGAYLKLILISSNNSCATVPQRDQEAQSTQRLVGAFKDLVDLHYREQHTATYYAQQLHVSPDHLQRIVKKAIGTTPKKYLQTRIVTEAKRMLYFGESTLKELSYDLGFKEPAHFSAFFKKCTGESPSAFAKKNNPKNFSNLETDG